MRGIRFTFPSIVLLASPATALFCAMAIAMPATAQARAEESEARAAAPMVVPQQVRYAGKLAARSGEAVEAVFRIYAAAEGGEPVWMETQQVSVTADGSYSVQLGAATPAGLPQAVFAGGAARWLGVTVERGEEQERVLLSSVPYAMKSADAESLAGHQAADFVTQAQLAGLTEQITQKVNKVEQAVATPAFQPELSPPPTGSGNPNTVPLWTSSSTLGNSTITQSGNKIGINFAAPSATLEVGGAMTVHGTLMFPPGVPATPASSSQSQSFSFSASAWDSVTSAPVSSTYTLAAGPTGNNTPTPNSVLYLNYQNGTSPVTTLFTVNGKGVLGLPNSAGGISSYGNISLSPEVWATSTASSNSPLLEIGASSFSSTTNAAKAQTFAWQALAAGNDTASPTGSLALLFGENGATPAATGFSIAPNGRITFAAGQTFPVTGTGGGTITGITTSSPLTGSGTTGSVALGLNTSVLETTLNGLYPQLAAYNTYTAGNNFSGGLSASADNGTAAVYATGTAGVAGVAGYTDSGIGIYGSASSTGFAGYFANNTTASAAVYAEDDATGNPGLGVALKGYVPNPYSIAVLGKSLGDNSYGVFGENVGGQDSYGVYSSVTGGGSTAIYAISSGGTDSNNFLGNGVVAISANGSGVLASSYGQSSVSSTVGGVGIWGVWGDTGLQAGLGFGAGVLGTAGDNYAGFFENDAPDSPTINVINKSSNEAALIQNDSSVSPAMEVSNTGGWGAGQMENYSSTHPTLFLSNNAGGPITDSTGMFKNLMATSPSGTCGIGGNGDLSCTGQVKSLVSAGGGARTVETYAPHSAEDWMEDYGTGVMQRGVSMVKIDPAFAETISESADYHVFITPRGDSKGLYVINATAAGFEVRESGGGTSSLTFDYKIVGKRRGYEAQRLRDVTQSFNEARANAAQTPKAPMPQPRIKSGATPAHKATANAIKASLEEPERATRPGRPAIHDRATVGAAATESTHP